MVTLQNEPEMITAEGRDVWYLEPERTLVTQGDLFVHTMNICRYNGALNWPLLRHLALCNCLAPLPDVKAYASSHDLHEAYVGDVVSGFKQHLNCYRPIEAAWEAHVHKSIGLKFPLHEKLIEEVKHIDQRALVIEMDMLDHPGASLVASKFGGPPTIPEREFFLHVMFITMAQCWEIVWGSIEEEALHQRGELYGRY